MATVYGVVNTVVQQTGATSVAALGAGAWKTAGYINGRVKCNIDYYACASDASGTVIQMGDKLPVGAMVIAHLLSVTVAQSSVTISVGDLDSATRYASASTVLQTAGMYLVNGLVSTVPYIIGTNPASGGVSTATATDNDQQIILTTGGASLGSTGVIMLITLFVTD